MRLVFLLLVATIACSRLPWQSAAVDACEEPTEEPLATLNSADYSLLVGSFRLVQVNSADTKQRSTIRVTPLRLHLADSAERTNARAKRLGNFPRNVDMAGTRDAMMHGYVDEAELDGTILYVGCRSCFDGSPDALQLYTVTAGGFSGRWLNSQSGITRVVRQDGSFGPNPAGHFCARRVPPGADQLNRREDG